jgi:two-component system, cell cycle sensor histidine kinase and response regulator CckA
MAGSREAIEAHLLAKGPKATPPTACNVDSEGSHGQPVSHDEELFALLGEFPTEDEEGLGDMQAYLQQANQIEAHNLFTRSIVHDLNNLMMGLFTHLELAKAELSSMSPAATHIDNAMGVFGPVRDLTRRLKSSWKDNSQVRKRVYVAELLNKSTRLSLCGSHVQGALLSTKDVWPVEVDLNQLLLVFNNLLINARQAMEDHGKLLLTVRNRVLADGQVADLVAGNYVETSIRDHGPGIPEPILKKIFDPYFTTKTEGSGLGLATSYATVRQHGGTIDVQSMSDGGAMFTVFLPAAGAS